MLRVLAVEDEAPQLEELLYLLRADPRVSRAEGASDSTEALRRIGLAVDGGPDGESAIDVIFLDINMPGLSGLDMARLLSGFAAPPLVVFVTAHEDFAVQAFDLEAVDYVLKPVHKARLAEAVRRAVEQVAARDGRGKGGAATAQRLMPAAGVGDPDHIPVELGGVTRFIPIDDILYAEAHGDYARLYTGRDVHLVRIPLSTLEEQWRPRGFVRVHRSHLVALGRIDELRLDRGSMSIRVGTAVLSVSRRHAGELRELLLRQAKGG
ncbi:LytR/AlgR family response regulator transcription factor [Actinoallomurus iriomotensis]|uniref:DNA-binding response regulator n=1 Tax=Actinoallomurus iriomotensis TaxID=478107 RepID=A0A9W6VMK2_9ACTN|nr:LytTR family DNA-binding domain-containing protein [Actinoallomurus iriomotensis]GLY73775.1 DNA-binding response regulator [Actinoallomurus iriomotensis]